MTTIVSLMPRQLGYVLAPVLISGALVAGTAVEDAEAFTGRDDLRTDAPVEVTPVVPDHQPVADPSADQVWQPDEVAADLPDPAAAMFALGAPARPAATAGGGDLPVSVRAASYGPGVMPFAGASGAVAVRVVDETTARAAGVDGLLVSVTSSASGPVDLSVDYSAFADRYGAGWGGRLGLVELPACALTTPERDGCLTPDPVASDNHAAAQRVSARLRLDRPAAAVDRGAPAAAVTQVFAVTAAAGSEGGDYRATDLSPAGSWSAGGGDGAFAYSYPLRLPPAEGPVPSVSLGYSSGSHDGRTSGSNNQASWVGDGWGYEPGFIERSYRACALDDEGAANNPDITGDLCWDADATSVTMSLDGTHTALVRDDSSGRWRAQADANWRIESLGSRASSSGATSERWKVTTTDGTQYFFASEVPASNSRLTVPVFGNHPGEPCRSSSFKDSSCRQAYRWLLDKAVDVNGNVARYFYATETGHYGAAADPHNRVAYHRASRLVRIEYGLREGSGVAATGRVLFTAADRCLSDCGSAGNPKAENWPDTPWDLHCDAAPCTSQLSPSFFATKRLTKITTRVRDGSAFRDVDSWALAHEFKDYGDADQAVLWLASIRHTGHVGGTISLPKVEFTGEALPNRVDAVAGVPVMWRWRLSSIKSETGAIITATYSDPQCARTNLPGSAHANSMRCHPARWTPEFLTEPVQDWFHKYVVTSVVETDTTGGMPAVETYYDYSTAGGGTSVLWAWDDSEFTEDEHRTYNQWRGYAQVTTRVGDPAEGQTRTRSRFYRGLDGQPLPSGGTRGVSLTDAEGNTVTDHAAVVGHVFETLAYNGGTTISGTTFEYWTRRTATQERDHAGGDLRAWLIGVSRERTRTRLTGSTWQRGEIRASYDSQGRAIRISDLGDAAATGDETCARTEYADNNTAWIKDAVRRTEVVGVDCDTSPSRPADLISDIRTFFDGSGSYGASPTRGLPTRVEEVDNWASGPVYVTTSRTEYDPLGRVVAVSDALDRTTATTYTPAGAGPVTRTVSTNALGHTTTVEFEPAWGVPTSTTDANGRVTALTYDAMGRSAGVWLPGRDRATQSASMRFAYLVRDDAPSAVTTERLNHRQEYVTSVALYDALLRGRQTQAETADRGRLLTEVRYDSQGRVDEEYGPNHHTSAPGTGIVRVGEADSARRIAYRYDGAGRVTDEIFYDKHVERWRTSTSYGGTADGLLVTVRPPHGAPATATVTNARGETVERRTYRSNAPAGAYDALTYRYDPSGRLERMTDQAGNQWSWQFDLRRRPVTAHDPDAGVTTMTYDAAGQLVSTTDARGETIVNGYDPLGRQVTRHDGAGTPLAEWEYDTAINGVGMLGRSVRWVDGQAYVNETRAVNAQGLVTQSSVTIPAAEGRLAGRYWFTQNYHPNGQLAVQGFDAAGDVEGGLLAWEYDHVGNPTRQVFHGDDTGTTVIVDEATFTPFNEVRTRRLGAGHARQGHHGFVYEEGTRRLERATFDRQASRHAVADLRYTYDDAGNVRSIVDVPEDLPANHELRCYRYDPQQRLVEAWAQGDTTGCAATPGMSVLGGPAPYWNSYEHDRVGNRTAETLRTPGQSAVARSYDYPSAGQLRPHGLREVTTVGSTDRLRFTYDQAGNTTSREVNGLVQDLRWDAEGRLAAVETGDDEVRMVYGADGERLIRDDGASATAYLPQTELTWDRGTDTMDGTRYYLHAGSVVAVCTGPDDADWTWMGVDQHGTTTHSVNAFTAVEQVRRHDPYGNPRGAPPGEWPGQQGFVGGVEDPVGLVHLGARSYDPGTGRFVSVDPVLALDNGQQINGYSYAYHNPISFSDPTGLYPGCPPHWCRSKPPTPKPRTPGCPEHWCRSKAPATKAPRPDHSTVTYPHGTEKTEFNNGDVAINGYVLPPGHPDPHELAQWIDDQVGNGPDELLLSGPLSEDPAEATAQLVEARCRLSRWDWDGFCDPEFHQAVRDDLALDQGGTIAVCISAGVYFGVLGGTVRDCLAFGAEGIARLAIVEGGGTGSWATSRWSGGHAVLGGYLFDQPLSELGGCGPSASAIAGRGPAVGTLGLNADGTNVVGVEGGVGIGGGVTAGGSCVFSKPLVTW